MALYSLGPLIGKLSSLDNVCLSLSMFVAGPVIGPIAGGFIAQSIGVKWVFIIVAILCAVAAAVGIPVLKETYAPIIRLRLAKKSADPEKAAKQHPTLVAAHGSKLHLLWINLSRPIVILTHSFVCFILSLYMSLCVVSRKSLLGLITQNSLVVCMGSTTSCSQPSHNSSQKFMGQYFITSSYVTRLTQSVFIFRFNTGLSGLAYIGLGLGFFIATMFGAKVADKIYVHVSHPSHP